MLDKIVLNEEAYKITENDLPALVTYGEHMGGSHLSIALVAQLFLSESKILFLTAYPMAKEKFLEQIGPDHSKVAFVNNISDLEGAKDMQAIILDSGNGTLFVEVAKSLPDLHQRVTLIKNMEVFPDVVFKTCLPLEKLLLSGNIDTCIAKEKISKMNFKTIIAFNQPETPLAIFVPSLEKYTGYLVSNDKSGIIKVKNMKILKLSYTIA